MMGAKYFNLLRMNRLIKYRFDEKKFLEINLGSESLQCFKATHN